MRSVLGGRGLCTLCASPTSVSVNSRPTPSESMNSRQGGIPRIELPGSNRISSYGQLLLQHYSPDTCDNDIRVDFTHEYRRVTSTTTGTGEDDSIGICALELEAGFVKKSETVTLPISEVIQDEDVTFEHFLEAMDT